MDYASRTPKLLFTQGIRMSPFLKTAIEAAKAAQLVIDKYYAGEFEVEIKPDQSPVTIADIETEETIKKIILDAFPDHGFFGEETGKENADADFLWLIDPIDGTKSFVRQYPFFSTQIALMYKGELIAGVSNAPIFEEMAWAAKGQGAFLNGKPIKVSEIAEVRDATLSTGNIGALTQQPEKWAALGDLINQVHRIRGYGDFYHYHLLAAGKIDMVVESDLNILDIAALAVIINEAGGIVTDFSGQPPGLEVRNLLAASNKAFHEDLLKRFSTE